MRFKLLALVCGALCATTALATDGVDTVYVYNGGANNEGHDDDIFTSAAQGWVFQNMGLLGPNGQPPTVNGNNLEDPDGNVVGTVIRDDNGDIIGYESGKTRAYNVDTSATMADAWNAVDSDGTVVVAKHGLDGGGGITLDDGEMYPGFEPQGGTGDGTGVPMGNDPYPLPPRPGASITLDLNGCNTDKDPDDAGPQDSVSGSAGGVPGVGGTLGNPDVIYKGASITITGPTQADVDAAIEKLKNKAKKAGFKNDMGEGNWAQWLASKPFPEQYSTLKNCLMGTGTTGSITYTKSPLQGTVVDRFDYYALLKLLKALEDFFIVWSPTPTEFIQVGIPADAIPPSLPPLPVFVHPSIIDTEILPLELEPATWPVEVEFFGVNPPPPLVLDLPGFVQETYFPPELPIVDVLFLPPDGGPPLPIPFNIPQPGIVEFRLPQFGTYVALTPAPPECPGDDTGTRCDTDLNGDCIIDNQDLGVLLAGYLTSAGDPAYNPAADFDNNGTIDNIDLGEMLADYLNDCTVGA